tara:strand:- start:97 stop:393 length:297 start_codon:yes stop_codon:yes gene_type:complete
MLSNLRELFSVVFIFVLFTGSSVLATPDAGSIQPLEPAWEKIDGQWNFNNSNKSERQILVHITSSRTNTDTKKLHIKDLVKLPFVVIVESKELETEQK